MFLFISHDLIEVAELTDTDTSIGETYSLGLGSFKCLWLSHRKIRFHPDGSRTRPTWSALQAR